jgi:GMP synthase-like glutamine amidotransferase
MILYLQHIDIERPETMALFFEKHGYSSKILELYNGAMFPQQLDGIDAVICLGGPMNVYEEDQYPFLQDENVFIQRLLDAQIPFLGICLGSQLLAKAAGAQVTRSPVEEIGWCRVKLTDDGLSDALFKGLGRDLLVYQWHGDTFSIPPNGKWLAKGQDCPRQALKVGSVAYGLQFHIEITDKSIEQWSDAYSKDSLSLLLEKKDMMLKAYLENKMLFEKEAEIIYTNFLNIIRTANP